MIYCRTIKQFELNNFEKQQIYSRVFFVKMFQNVQTIEATFLKLKKSDSTNESQNNLKIRRLDRHFLKGSIEIVA